jgi:hypothetical protein
MEAMRKELLEAENHKSKSGAGAGRAKADETDEQRSIRFFAQAQQKRELYNKGMKKDLDKQSRIRQGFAAQGLDSNFMQQVYDEHQAMIAQQQELNDEQGTNSKGKPAESLLQTDVKPASS